MGTITEKTMFFTSDGAEFAERSIAEKYEALLDTHGYERVKRLYTVLCRYGFTEPQTATTFAVLRKAATHEEIHDCLLQTIREEAERHKAE